MNQLQEFREKNGIIIAAHRGTNGGNILQNTSKAYYNAIRHKADMFEVDVVRSQDGDFFAFHDGQEPLVFNDNFDIRTLNAKEITSKTCFNSVHEPINQKIETIEQILDTFEGQVFINIDRSWFYWDTFLDKLKGYKSLEQILLKSPVERHLLEKLRDSGLDVMYMPIVKTMEELDLVLNFKGLNIVAIELIFETLDTDLVSPKTIQLLKNKGLLIWGNALTLSDTIVLSAGLDDDSAIENDGQSWGRLVKLGFDIIQTDWPYLLYSYLTANNLKNN
ncbi:glycerophosphodiester phosphodiesterase family protein [Streptococcus pacificus]|uniref:Glycerophosphodiester phosphodiesterase family protein n=1 Tax=Streptococcus pacificus TaxID=2740577 RepID=A0ABS0ZLF7_9STRE|nr:glycerophosphodiester phosphodiesterase family protein [Streptococcus pacificus]MBJ8326539.1 glycerophosphodiester phosphodiesterase family protein [Streptococcus pacificus]